MRYFIQYVTAASILILHSQESLAANSVIGPPTTFMYQGRIVDSSGVGLQHHNVSFEFTILSASGTCPLYREQVTGIDMRNSKGIFEVAIGTGSKSYPASTSFTLLDAFNNSGILHCDGSGTYTPLPGDGRVLRVQFFDGTGWRLISPDSIIRSVPFAGFALSAQKLGNYSSDEFVLKAAVPTCTGGDVLTYNGTTFTCMTVSGGGGGGAPTGAASGDLAGTYPGPSIAANAVTSAKILDGSIGTADLASGTVAGQVLRYSGTAWQHRKLAYTDLVNSSALSPWPTTSCTTSEYISWSSSSDSFVCTAFSAATTLGYTPARETRTITAGTGLTGGGDLSANRTLSVDVGTTAGKIPQLDSGGKLDPSVIPALAGSGVTSVGVAVPAYMTTSGGPVTSSGNITLGFASQTAKTVFAAPQGANGAPTFRNLNIADIQSNVSGNFLTASGACASGQSLTYLSASDTISCQAYSLTSAQVTAVLPTNVVVNGGNAATAAMDIGSTTAFGLNFMTSNSPRITILSAGNVGIGTATPGTKLEVAGQVKITGGTPGLGKVLTSDAAGLATWETIAASSSGTVTSVTAGTGLTGGPITTSGTLAVDVGTTANKIVQLDASAALPAVSGTNVTSLNATNISSGTLPAARLPAFTGDVTTSAGSAATTIANNAVNSAKISDGTVGVADLNFAGTMTTNTGLVVRNGTQLFNMTCAADEILIWNATNGWECSSVKYTEGDPQVGTNSTNYLSKWNGSALVTSGVYDDGTNVGIGTASPGTKLHVNGVISNTVSTFTSAFTCNSTTLSFAASNFIRFSPSSTIAAGSCVTTLSGMTAGSNYTLVVTGNGAVNAVTYSFAGYTFKYLPTNAATKAAKDSIYTFLYDGTTVYVTWAGGY